MSFVIAAPEMVASAASALASIGSMIGEANAAAVAPTTGVVAAAEDEVSAAIASLFSSHAQNFQALSAQASAFHTQFVQALNGAGSQYVAAEAAGVSQLRGAEQQVLGVIRVGALITPNTCCRCLAVAGRRAASVGCDQCAHPGAGGTPADRQRRQRGRGDRG